MDSLKRQKAITQFKSYDLLLKPKFHMMKFQINQTIRSTDQNSLPNEINSFNTLGDDIRDDISNEMIHYISLNNHEILNYFTNVAIIQYPNESNRMK